MYGEKRTPKQNATRTIMQLLTLLVEQIEFTQQISLTAVKHEINSFSAHYNFITLKRKTKQVEKNKSYWILAPSIIKEEQFNEQIKSFWQIWRQQKPIFPNTATWWEKGKEGFQTIAKSYQIDKKSKQNKERNKIKKNIRNLYKKIETKPEFKNHLENYKAQLNAIEKEEFLKWKHISKLKIETEGEQCSAFFFQQIQKRKNQKEYIYKLNKKQGGNTENEKEILEEIQNFFSDLYNPGEDHSTELEKNDYISALKNKIPETEKNLY